MNLDDMEEKPKPNWRDTPTGKISSFKSNRKATLARATERMSLPTLQTCLKYNIKKEELEPIFDMLIFMLEKNSLEVD